MKEEIGPVRPHVGRGDRIFNPLEDGGEVVKGHDERTHIVSETIWVPVVSCGGELRKGMPLGNACR